MYGRATEWTKDDWKMILLPMYHKKCAVFLGAGVSAHVIPSAGDIAESLAAEVSYPMSDSKNLARVAQFMGVKFDSMLVNMELSHMYGGHHILPDFDEPDEPHRVLASLPISVYITTNYDSFMTQALRYVGKEPRTEYCRWNAITKSEPSIFDHDPGLKPTLQNPIVFHLHGCFEVPYSMVLKEDDYLDFLMNMSEDPGIIPIPIRQALLESTFIFMGYSFKDWNFSVLFRSIARALEKSISPTHISVLLPPAEEDCASYEHECKVAAQEYLERYLDKYGIRAYWGTCRKFAKELKDAWEAFNREE